MLIFYFFVLFVGAKRVSEVLQRAKNIFPSNGSHSDLLKNNIK